MSRLGAVVSALVVLAVPVISVGGDTVPIPRKKTPNLLVDGPLVMVDAEAADLNGDGKVDYADEQFVWAHRTENAVSAIERRCDVDGDGKVDPVDEMLVWSVGESLRSLDKQQALLDSGELRPAPFFDVVGVRVIVDGKPRDVEVYDDELRKLSDEALGAVCAALRPGREFPADREGRLKAIFRDEGNDFVNEVSYRVKHGEESDWTDVTSRYLMRMSEFQEVRLRDGTVRCVSNEPWLISTVFIDENGSETTRRLETPAELNRHGSRRLRFVWTVLTEVRLRGPTRATHIWDPRVLEILRRTAAERGVAVLNPSTEPGVNVSRCGDITLEDDEELQPIEGGDPGNCAWPPWRTFAPLPTCPVDVQNFGPNNTPSLPSGSRIVLRKYLLGGQEAGPYQHGCGQTAHHSWSQATSTGFNVEEHWHLKAKVREVWGFGIGGNYSWSQNREESTTLAMTMGDYESNGIQWERKTKLRPIGYRYEAEYTQVIPWAFDVHYTNTQELSYRGIENIRIRRRCECEG